MALRELYIMAGKDIYTGFSSYDIFFKTNFISGPNTESEVTLIEGLYYNQSLFFLLSSSSGGRKDISKAGAQKLGQLSDFDLLL